ncbi:bifunctional glutamate N-acetyltransferase/amino-acid acetyltransferase ArgJ [Bartonella tamiae]|uniref:Arginine biosynthesis bifunctional protein ArgJ n=1 Tax=Bartonella tamiae Th239 TaxID=1094558 RepID=J0ZPG6_9HYPH|nr:bifunctional glutamate N-acetyltransferase/amino-acid acetyltransferase ArgJ [Bartonella tamiae]EJF90468.1 glutamate N-acetyltransferase/amino-acid acetyltransferase [Bartonella tamiae Th239]EJF93588.1 glutamate N-acetyltransferase/amino-acid acetyltransferase [Bartonella tamiae Th307]
MTSPLEPKTFPHLPTLKGVHIKTAQAGIKYCDRTDLLIISFDKAAEIAGIFTQSKCPSAPVEHCRNILSHGRARALIVNSGNANAFTGKKGKLAVEQTLKAAADQLNIAENEIYLASTGVIGEPLNATRIIDALPNMINDTVENTWLEAAQAIMTTDTFPKIITQSVDFGGDKITINGIAKGAGMIAPNMATMLSFIVTDAPISSQILQKILSEKVSTTFNSITVDSDTSTSDTLLLCATGQTEKTLKPLNDIKDPRYVPFAEAIENILHNLSLQVVGDGEGARHLIEVQVKNAKSKNDARCIAFSIANSPLVKTAIAGEDANWGRVVMAVGKAGVEADRDRLSIWFGDYRVAVNGERDNDYNEVVVSDYMKKDHIVIKVDIDLGQESATVWTCDLTKDYVEINGDYRS